MGFSRNKDEAGWWKDKGDEFFKADMYPQATACYQRARSEDPKSEEILGRLVLTLKKMWVFDESADLDDLDSVLALVRPLPKTSEDWIEAGKGCTWGKTQKGYDNALMHYSVARRIDPGNAGILGYMARAYHGKREHGMETKCYYEAWRIDPGNAEILRAMCYALWEQGKYNDAIDRCTEASKAHPGNAEIKELEDMAFEKRMEARARIIQHDETLR